jgi:hypothetical protein
VIETDTAQDRDSASKTHDILNTAQKMTVPRALAQQETPAHPPESEGPPHVPGHAQRSRSDRLRTPRAGSVDVDRERDELPTPPSTHPNKNKEKYRAAPVPVSPTPATQFCRLA